MIDPDDGRLTYSYDVANRLDNQINSSGERTTYTYDAAGRPTEERQANGVKTVRTYKSDGTLNSVLHRKSDKQVAERTRLPCTTLRVDPALHR